LSNDLAGNKKAGNKKFQDQNKVVLKGLTIGTYIWAVSLIIIGAIFLYIGFLPYYGLKTTRFESPIITGFTTFFIILGIASFAGSVFLFSIARGLNLKKDWARVLILIVLAVHMLYLLVSMVLNFFISMIGFVEKLVLLILELVVFIYVLKSKSLKELFNKKNQ